MSALLLTSTSIGSDTFSAIMNLQQQQLKQNWQKKRYKFDKNNLNSLVVDNLFCKM